MIGKANFRLNPAPCEGVRYRAGVHVPDSVTRVNFARP